MGYIIENYDDKLWYTLFYKKSLQFSSLISAGNRTNGQADGRTDGRAWLDQLICSFCSRIYTIYEICHAPLLPIINIPKLNKYAIE